MYEYDFDTNKGRGNIETTDLLNVRIRNYKKINALCLQGKTISYALSKPHFLYISAVFLFTCFITLILDVSFYLPLSYSV